jgi:hypothetical protein
MCSSCPLDYAEDHKREVSSEQRRYAMYYQINPTEMFRERQLALLREAEHRRLARRLRARRTPKVRSTIAATSFLVALVVASLMLVRLSSPAQASTTFTVNSTADFADMVGQTITATATKNSTLDTSEFSAPRKVVSC